MPRIKAAIGGSDVVALAPPSAAEFTALRAKALSVAGGGSGAAGAGGGGAGGVSYVFPSPFVENPSTPMTVRQMRMMVASQTIRRKPRWWAKLADAGVCASWEGELAAEGLRPDNVAWVMAHARWCASRRDAATGIEPAAVELAWQCDGLIAPALKARLVSMVTALEAGPVDWHPGSNEQVRDLIHPSLFPLMWGLTPLWPEPAYGRPWPEALAGAGAVPSVPPTAGDSFTSTSFQWLPADFSVAEDGAVSIDSYINNLHPLEHADAYGVIADVFARFVPLFERVLTDMQEVAGLHHAHRSMYRHGRHFGDHGMDMETAPITYGERRGRVWGREVEAARELDVKPLLPPGVPMPPVVTAALADGGEEGGDVDGGGDGGGDDGEEGDDGSEEGEEGGDGVTESKVDEGKAAEERGLTMDPDCITWTLKHPTGDGPGGRKRRVRGGAGGDDDEDDEEDGDGDEDGEEEEEKEEKDSEAEWAEREAEWDADDWIRHGDARSGPSWGHKTPTPPFVPPEPKPHFSLKGRRLQVSRCDGRPHAHSPTFPRAAACR